MDSITLGRYEALRLEINSSLRKINKLADNKQWGAIEDWEGDTLINEYKNGFRHTLYDSVEQFIRNAFDN